MYQYTDFDKSFVQLRAAQYRDQLQRWQAGKLSEDEFKPLRLQNGWYIQRYAPMLRVAVPYGELSSPQLRVLARIAREFDQPDTALLQEARATQDKLGDIALSNGKVLGSAQGYNRDAIEAATGLSLGETAPPGGELGGARPPGAAQVVQVRSAADYTALPSGTVYTDPNGVQRRKP